MVILKKGLSLFKKKIVDSLADEDLVYAKDIVCFYYKNMARFSIFGAVRMSDDDHSVFIRMLSATGALIYRIAARR